jgi:hypothetical protein
MELQRVQVDPDAIAADFSSLQQVLEAIQTSSVPIPENRPGKRITVVAAICADGTFTKPMVIIPRHKIDADLQLFGVLK